MVFLVEMVLSQMEQDDQWGINSHSIVSVPISLLLSLSVCEQLFVSEVLLLLLVRYPLRQYSHWYQDETVSSWRKQCQSANEMDQQEMVMYPESQDSGL
jgi:hypothetical protein